MLGVVIWGGRRPVYLLWKASSFGSILSHTHRHRHTLIQCMRCVVCVNDVYLLWKVPSFGSILSHTHTCTHAHTHTLTHRHRHTHSTHPAHTIAVPQCIGFVMLTGCGRGTQQCPRPPWGRSCSGWHAQKRKAAPPPGL